MRVALFLLLWLCALSAAGTGCDYPALGGAPAAHGPPDFPTAVRAHVPEFAAIGTTEAKANPAWAKTEKDLRKKAFDQLQRFAATDAGKIELEKLVWAQIEEWKQPGKYPTGLTPKDWDSHKAGIHTVGDFFAFLATQHLVRDLFGNLKSVTVTPSGMIEMGITRPEILERYRDRYPRFAIFSVVAAQHGVREKDVMDNF